MWRSDDPLDGPGAEDPEGQGLRPMQRVYLFWDHAARSCAEAARLQRDFSSPPPMHILDAIVAMRRHASAMERIWSAWGEV